VDSVHEVRFTTFTAWRSVRLTSSDGSCRFCESLNGKVRTFLEGMPQRRQEQILVTRKIVKDIGAFRTFTCKRRKGILP
jgi:hypothetical protein